MDKTYEVELKFRIDQPDVVLAMLHRYGAIEETIVKHVDRYFNHPSRDFRQTDEAFRVRSVNDENRLTYKGAVVGSRAKTRHEIEVEFATGPQSTDQLLQMVQLLGFRFVRDVVKTRRGFSLRKDGYSFEIALDEVPELGYFLEIELLAADDERQAAEAALWKLANDLELFVSESKSYLNLLLELDSQHCHSGMLPVGDPGKP